MRKIKQYKGFVIAEATEKELTNKDTSYKYHAYLKDDWSLGKGYRYPEWEADNLHECIEFIDCY